MNRLIIFSLCVAMLAACQAPKEEVTNSTLEALQAQKKSIAGTIKELTTQLKSIEEKIALQDTTKKAPLVSSLKISKSEFNHYFKVQGNVESDKNATLYPEAQGLIKAIYVREGQSVSRGQKLLSIDNDIIANQISEVETQLALATDVFERTERLWNQNIGSELQFLESKSRKESLEKTIATLRKQQSMATLRAPFSGIVDKIYPKVGEMGSPMAPAVTVVNLSKLHTVANVSEKYLDKVKKNMPVQVTFGQGLDTVSGVISNLGRSINPANRTFEIKVNFKEKSEFLRPNLMAEVTVNDFKQDSAIVIPASYVLQDTDGQFYVYIIKAKGGKKMVKKTIVETGLTYENKTMILSGLSEGDLIVTEGARKLVNGKEVRLN